MSIINIVDTGNTTGVAKYDTGETVIRKVYRLTKKVEESVDINEEVLLKEKDELLKRISEIDEILAEMK